MNRIVFRFASLGVLLAAALFLGGKEEKRPAEISQIVHFLLRRTSSEGTQQLSFSLEEGVYRGELKGRGIREKIILPDRIVRELEEILGKYDAGSWNGFSKEDRKSTDSFLLEVEFDNGDLLEAKGRGIYPDKYPEMEEEIFRSVKK